MSNLNMTKAIEDIARVVEADLSDAQKRALSDVIGDLVAQILRDHTAAVETLTRNCCQHHTDIAHSITQQLKAETTALVANLSAMR